MSHTAKPANVLFGASPNDAGWQAGIHTVVLRIGRHFGFQAFNLDTRTENTANPTYTPATIFLVTDHLHHLLVKNYLRRDKAPGSDDDKFERAVYRLHAGIFQAYRDWCKHVDIVPRLPQLEWEAICEVRGNVLEWEFLLEELALYFLIYSEAANLRHMPEAMWFIFWIVRNSQYRIAGVTGIPADDPDSANQACRSESHKGMIRKQMHLRNRYHREIAALRNDYNVKPDGDYKSDRDLADIRRAAATKIAPIFGGATMEVKLLADMVAYGDSGAFLDRIVEPIFNYLAIQVDELGTKGQDIQWRVAYDDCNESLASKQQVHRVLKVLGIKINSRKRVITMERDPYETLLEVGEQRVAVVADDGDGTMPVAPAATLGWGWQDACNWWSKVVFGKTYIERRSWLTIGRAFYRVWLFLVLEFQAMCVFLWGWDTDYRYYWLSSLVGTHAFANLLYEIAGGWTQRSTNRSVRLLGSPFWKHHARGILDWLIILGVLTLCFVAQWLDFIKGVTLWWYAAGGYGGLVVIHAVLTQRDGYTISVTHSIAGMFRACGLIPIAWLFEWLGASSARPPAEQYLMPYTLKTGWSAYFSNMAFWILVIGCKVTFDWFAVMQTMKLSVEALMNANWLGDVGYTETPNPLGPEYPPILTPNRTGFDLDVILAIGRVLPGFLVIMNDMQVFYYIIGSVFGVLKGLLQLNLGSITSFQELVLTFHKAQEYWWNRCMSDRGSENIARQVQRAMSPDISQKPAGAYQFESLADAARRRNTEREAALLSEQVVDATSVLTARNIRNDRSSQRFHLEDSELPRWLAFSDVWNGIVDELRQVDLVSNAEADNLRFVYISLDETTEVVSGMRPIMLPVFFYGGQVARALEAPGNDPTQHVVLSEIRALLVYLLVQTGIINSAQAAVMADFQPVSKPINLDHRTKRSKGVTAITKLLTTFKAIMSPCTDHAAASNRNDAISSMANTLHTLINISDVEVGAVLEQHTRPARDAQERDGSRLQHTRAKNMGAVLEELRSNRLDPWQWREFWGENGGLEGIYHEAPPSTARSNVAKVVEQLHKMLSTSAKGAQPRGEEAQRILSFFMASLKNPTLETPPAVDDMLSWNVLTPHYEEDVLYALNSKNVANHFGLPVSSAKGLSDLMSENEDGVTVMAWLRSNYPLDWNNLLERLDPALKKANLDGRLVNETDFDDGGPLASERMQVLHWASYRGQLLARTVRGMMAYEAGLRLLARIENPNPGVSSLRYNSAIDDLVRSKFCYVVASQQYGDLRKAPHAKGRWLARGIEYLLHQHLGLRVAFLDSLYGARGKKVQHAVLVRARGGTPVEDRNCTEELYRVRLPVNHLEGGGHGVILGEGKPENQNAAMIFCFGEVVQAIDMNQDNYLCEAVKMRNLINEFNPPSYTEAALVNATKMASRRRAGLDAVRIPVSQEIGDMAINGSGGVSNFGATPAAFRGAGAGQYAYERPFPDMRNMPVALVGFREWVFSQDSGALASFAAATEFTFGSMIQRIMTWPGSVRFHYGHPDLWNKIFVMTRGGVSKATRAFHISEDVFAGYNHVVRGGRVKFKEYIACGKGRDMGFDSINSFESKVSGGNGEQVMSRDVYRLGTHFDFFRLLAFYHSGPGFFINSYLVLFSVYANLWMLTMLALTNTQLLPDPNDPLRTISTLSGQPTSVAVQQVIQIGMFSIITYAVELILEYGLVKALATLFLQLLQGSLSFFIFRSRTTAYFFLTDVQFGGAKYIPTGRGYALKHNSFVKVYSNYARSHLYYAAELLLLLILLALLGPLQYATTTWSTWMVCISILWAPFWFNPGSFLLEKTKDDFEAWSLWMNDVVDPETNSTWDSWNKQQLEKPRNDRETQTNPLATGIRGVLGALPTAVMTLGAVTNLEDTRWNKWAVFGVITGAFWSIMVVLVIAYRYLVVGRHYRIWRLVRTFAMLCLLAFFICAIVFIPSAGSGIGVKNLVLIIFANFSFASVVIKSLLYLAPRGTLGPRSIVDSAYRILDYILGYFFFFFLFLLSFLQVFNAVQGALLYNIKFSRKLEEARMLGSNNYLVSYIDRASERINNNLKAEINKGSGGGGGGGNSSGSGAPPPTAPPGAVGVKMA